MKFAIIGASGFIGLHTGEYFRKNGADVDLYSREKSLDFLKSHFPSSVLYRSDSDEFWSRAKDYSAVIYLSSAAANGTVLSEVTGNVSLAVSFFERLAAINARCHVIYASSGGTIYGPGHAVPIVEEAAPNPISPYGVGKSLIETSLKFLAFARGVPVSTLRIANPVGYWQLSGPHGFVTAAIRSAMTNQKLRVFGDGSNLRDYFDVDDLSRLLLMLASEPHTGYRVNNVGSGIESSEIDVVTAVEGVLGVKLFPEMIASRLSDLKYAVLDPSRTRREFGWVSNLPIADLAEKVVRAARERGFPDRSSF
ncbi:NAD-dependent epimerase/dehydratase family protein [Ensifer sp. MJa1]|uniref:NAD-dependent epimerase/dehydratase family protein n=1 Tax=Ensifer sp. MJa1 TaxID=2919888 RepID=UPI00300A2824